MKKRKAKRFTAFDAMSNILMGAGYDSLRAVAVSDAIERAQIPGAFSDDVAAALLLWRNAGMENVRAGYAEPDDVLNQVEGGQED
jgi:hypothetical protein